MSRTLDNSTSTRIPAPPHDPALPGLPTALDGDAVRTLLAPHVTDGCRLVSVRPAYVRYKPGTSCLVQYELDFAGRPGSTLAHVKLFAGVRAQKLWAKGSLQQLAAQNGSAPLASAAHLPELGAVLHTFPVDPALPALVAAASPAAELVRYKPGRKALLRYGPAYAKLYDDERAPLVFAAGRAVEAAGIATAHPLACFPSLRMAVHAEVAGVPLRDLHGGAFAAGVRAAGEALGALHAIAVPGLPRHTCADEAGELAAAARAVATLRPELGEDAARVAADVTDLLAELAGETTATHGDFSDDQVLVAADGVVLLDFDESRAAHPWRDVGNFLAHLALRGDDAARSSFLDGYGLTDDERLRPFEAGALLKLAVDPFRRLEANWPIGLERRLALARGRLPSTTGRPVDAALPQLAALTNPSVVAAALGREVLAATIVRHKPGRRCVLRYELDGSVLYGKTYASDRGPRVFRNLQALAMPEPVAFLAGLRLLLQPEVRGTPVRAALLAGEAQVAARIAEAVHALHRRPVTLAREHALADELNALRIRIEALTEHRGRAQRCFARLERAAEEPCSWRSAPVHRDLYHDQVLLDDGRPILLDLDDAAMSEPALDVANFLAHLRLLALQEPQRRVDVAKAAAAFRSRYAALDPLLDPRLVRLLEAGTLLRLACIHAPLGRPLLRECEALLPAEAPAVRLQPGSQLEGALDGRAVLVLAAASIEKHAGVRPTACRAFLLRHKKGRAVVLYRFETAAGELAFIGKWFADGGGTVAAEVHTLLRARGFAGADFAVAAPVLHDPELGVLITEAAEGPSLRDVLDDEPEQATRAGGWLARFHGCGALLTHGDFAAADVLVPARGPTVVVDFDNAAPGDPAFDVANFEATLELRGLRRYGDPNAFAAAVSAFRSGYEEYAPLPPLAPAVEALVWARLAESNLRGKPAGAIGRHALARSASVLDR